MEKLEEYIKSVLEYTKWIDISIQVDPDGKNALILVCETKDNADSFWWLLERVKYKVTRRVLPENGKYSLLIKFTDTIYAIGCDTDKTLESYPLLNIIDDGLIDYVTTGVKIGYDKQDNGVYLFNKPTSIFDRIHLN